MTPALAKLVSWATPGRRSTTVTSMPARAQEVGGAHADDAGADHDDVHGPVVLLLLRAARIVAVRHWPPRAASGPGRKVTSVGTNQMASTAITIIRKYGNAATAM